MTPFIPSTPQKLILFSLSSVFAGLSHPTLPLSLVHPHPYTPSDAIILRSVNILKPLISQYAP